MPGNLQPLVNNQKIVDSEGKPTEYFIRWAQARQIDITSGASLTEAQGLVDAFAQSRSILTGNGLSGGGNLTVNRTLILDTANSRNVDHSAVNIAAGTGLTGGGDITASRTLALSNTAVTPGSYTNANITVDQQGRITAAASGAGGGGGGGGSRPWWWAPPPASAFTLLSGNAVLPTLADDTDIGLVMNTGASNVSGIVKGAFKVPPAGDFTLDVHLTNSVFPGSYYGYGVALIEASTQKYRLFWVQHDAAGRYYQARTGTMAGGFTAVTNYGACGNETFLRVQRVGVDIFFSIGHDGKNYVVVWSTNTSSTFSGIGDYIGFVSFLAGSYKGNCYVNCDRWVQTW